MSSFTGKEEGYVLTNKEGTKYVSNITMLNQALGQYEVEYSENAANIEMYSREYLENESCVFFREAIEKHELVAHPAIRSAELSVALDCSLG